jgi:FKBP-type peptidyl-prolyl cis-trans isomerase
MALKRPAIALFAIAAVAAAALAWASELTSEQDQTLYAVGVRLGRSLSPFMLSQSELETVLLGVRDAALGRELAVNETARQGQIDALLRERRAPALAAEREASAEFLAGAARAPGAVRTPSGLVMRALRAGSGPTPQAGDSVRLHYHGRLRDGNVFDSSVERGVPAQVALARALPCWREALLLMHAGGKSELVCPAELAYGASGDPPRVAGGAAVVYEIELLSIDPR